MTSMKISPKMHALRLLLNLDETEEWRVGRAHVVLMKLKEAVDKNPGKVWTLKDLEPYANELIQAMEVQ